MATTDLARIVEIMAIWDDVGEPKSLGSPDGLQELYPGINHETATVLALVLSGRQDPDCNTYAVPQQYHTDYMEMLTEALHGGLDGWEPEHQVVIYAFLSDWAYAVSIK